MTDDDSLLIWVAKAVGAACVLALFVVLPLACAYRNGNQGTAVMGMLLGAVIGLLAMLLAKWCDKHIKVPPGFE